MGSIFTTLPDEFNKRDIDGRIFKYPQYLQFQPGTVVSVINSEDSSEYDNTLKLEKERTSTSGNRVGSIIAMPYYSDRGGVIRKSMMGEKILAYEVSEATYDLDYLEDIPAIEKALKILKQDPETKDFFQQEERFPS